ncbi:hypothetical protein [Sorangium sp. So ce1335]|uniref:hypothetical protein n=1 Tax=Sorangium sp. So ce1335 TaxID=3133335 RepID=UPI003F632CEA
MLVDEIGSGTLRAERPGTYFNPKNPQWPESAALPISLPPSVQTSDADEFRREVARILKQHEDQARANARRKKRDFLGAARAREVSPYERATSIEPLRELNPTFAVGRGRTEAHKHAIAALRAFRAAYRQSLEHWRAGVRSAVFPAGTWWMRVFHGVAVNGGELEAA